MKVIIKEVAKEANVSPTKDFNRLFTKVKMERNNYIIKSKLIKRETYNDKVN